MVCNILLILYSRNQNPLHLGLRCLTVKSACLDLNFYVRDIQALVAKYLPTLPRNEENLYWKNLVGIFKDQLNEKELNLISTINFISAQHIG